MIRPALSTLLLASVALAQAPEAPAAPDRTQEFLEAQQGRQDALLGTFHYALILQGSQNMGHASFVIEAAPEGSGATYKVASTLSMTFGPRKNEGQIDTLLDERFAVLEEVEDNHESARGGGMVEKSSTVKREGDTWHFSAKRVEPGAEQPLELTLDHEHAGDSHSDMASMLLMARAFDRAAPGTYRFETLEWPSPGDEAQTEPTIKPLEVTVPAAATTISQNGAEHQVHAIRVASGEQVMLFYVDAQGRLLALEPEGTPIRFVLVTDAEAATQDQGETQVALGAGAKGPKDAVMLYFAVLAKQQPVAQLDTVMDWASIQAELGAEDENIRAMSPKAVADLLKEQFAKQPTAFPPEQLQLIESTLKVTENEAQDEALVTMEDLELKVVRKGEGWFLTSIPH